MKTLFTSDDLYFVSERHHYSDFIFFYTFSVSFPKPENDFHHCERKKIHRGRDVSWHRVDAKIKKTKK